MRRYTRKAAQPCNIRKGLHYFLIEGAPPVPEGSNEVVEVFSYMCSHCNTFEPYINSWAKRNAENVRFSRIPVVFGRKAWEIYARAFVTAQMMGLGDEAHAALMEAIWKDKVVMRSMQDLAEFYSKFGVDPKSLLQPQSLSPSTPGCARSSARSRLMASAQRLLLC